MATPNPSPIPPFDSLLNFRDVGHTINALLPFPMLKPGLLYRSARPDSASPTDRQRLATTYAIKTILDLRTETEHLSQKTTTAITSTNGQFSSPATQQPTQIPHLTYREINLNGPAYSRALLKQLSYRQAAKLLALYALNYRTAAISILGSNVMAQRGLTGLAQDSLHHSTGEIRAIFALLACPPNYPILVHCTQGKDRTGLVVLLVLLLLRVPQSAIEVDYCLSETELLPEKQQRLREIAEIGLPVAFAECPADWVEVVSAWIDDRYGGVEAYLLGCGVSAAQQNAVRAMLGAA